VLIREKSTDTSKRSDGEGEKSEREASIRGAAGVDLRRVEKAICTKSNTKTLLIRQRLGLRLLRGRGK